MTEQGTQKGLYGKYIVTKASGKPLAPGSEFIVLRIDDGRYLDACRAGVKAFADAVLCENPLLARDLYIRLAELEQKQGGGVHIVHAENYSGMHCSICCAEWNDKTVGCSVCEAYAAAPLPIEEAQASAATARSGF